MSRFLITMNMPSRSGGLIHQVICEHPAKTLDEFVSLTEGVDFVTVEEFYRNADGSHYSMGRIALSVMHMGKVKMDVPK